jgi:hypothetical protein
MEFDMKDKRELLKTGVFGVTDEGEKFVVAGDTLVYQDGSFDELFSLDKDLCFISGRKIEKLVKCKGYGALQGTIDGSTSRPIIYDREKETPIEMTIAEIEAKLGIKNLKIVKEGK